MLDKKWNIPILVATCIHMVLFIWLITVVIKPAVAKEPEYMEISIAELFKPVESVKEEPNPASSKTAASLPANSMFNSSQTSPEQVHTSLAEVSSVQSAIVNSSSNSSVQVNDDPVSTPAVATTISRGPRVISSQEPFFSEEARRRGWQGTVRVRVIISEQGSVREVQLVESSGYSQLDEAALSCLRSWQFSPALREGYPVAAKIVIPITFKLR